MAAITWEELVQKGGGNIHYIFTVAGYPWAVTDHPDVKTLLDAGDTAGKTARQKIFGSTLLNSPELLTDGDMEADGTSAWTVGNGATLTKDTSQPKRGDQCLRVSYGTTTGPYAYQYFDGTVGKKYRVRGWARSVDGEKYPKITGMLLSSVASWTGTTSKSWQRFDFEETITQSSPFIALTVHSGASGNACEFDGITVKEVTTYLAESTTKFPVFVTLDNVSNQRWNLSEISGSISGGSWSVDIADLDLGHAWNTTSNVGNANTWGIPGVHAIAQPYSDSNVGFGNLLESCAQSATTLTVYEQDGGTLDAGIPDGDDPDTEYRLLWINQECVAASSVMPNSDEEVTDGDMEAAGTTAWSSFDSAVLTKSTSSPHGGSQALRNTSNGSRGSAYQSVLTVGKIYRIRGWARGDGSQGYPSVGKWTADLWTGTTSTSWQIFDVEFTATDARFNLKNENATVGAWVEFDDVTIKEVTTSNDITLTARGVARSRDADHWTNFYEGVTNPLVLDTPPSIIDKPCTLFGIGLSDDGSSILTQPVKIREGVVGTNIKTRDGITNISILSFLNRLDNDLQLPKYDGNLARYVFYRGDVALGDTNTINGFEMPHLVIREYDPTDSTDTVGTNKYIWLSSTESSAEYDTVDDILEALSYKFGSSLASAYLQYKYFIRNGKVHQTDSDGSQTYRLSLMTGPLAWILNLGAAPANTAGGNLKWSDRQLAEKIGSKSPEMFDPTPEMLTGNQWQTYPWMTCLEGTGGSASNTKNINNRFLEPHEYWIAPYYYSYMWDEDDKDELSVGSPMPETDNFIIPEESGGTTQYLYLTGEDAATQFQVGEEISIGSPNDDFSPSWPNYARFEIASIAADSGFTKITATSGYVTKADTKTPFVMGRPLFTMPAFDIAFQDSLTENPAEYYDMWELGERPTTEAPTLGKLFRAILNDPGHGVDIPSILQLTHIAGFTTEGDEVSIIDWDDLDEKSKQAREELRLGKYKLLVTDSVNLYDIFRNEMVLHGLTPTYEWEQESGQYRIKFRHMAPSNTTQAVFSGRVINNSNLIRGQTTESSHNDTWLANSGEFKTNYMNGQHYRTYNLTYQSGSAMNRRASRSISVRSIVSHIGASYPDAGAYLMKMVRYFSRPNPILKSQLGLSAFVDVALGQEVAVNDETARNPYSHELGLTDEAAIVMSISYDWMRGLMTVSYKLEDENIYGYAPACYVTSGNSEKIGSKQISCNSELHEFSNLSDRVDCMWFDCYYWNQSTNTYTAKGCSCGEYKIIAFERYTNTPTLLYFNVESVSSDGTIVIEDQDGSSTNYNAWVTTKNYVLIFADWDDVESCQQKFLYFADENDTLGTGNDRGFRWG